MDLADEAVDIDGQAPEAVGVLALAAQAGQASELPPVGSRNGGGRLETGGHAVRA